MMGGVNVVLLVLLVWTFTSVCVGWESRDDITIDCEYVTALVGDEIILTCTVSNLNKECCVEYYKFINTAADDAIICKVEFSSDSCKQLSRFSCPYTANKPMTTTFKFYLQTNCGAKTTYFSVSTTDITKCEDVTAHVEDKINLTCTVAYPRQNCCMTMYKFINTAAADDDPEICREVFRSVPCIQESRFSCPYTANKPMTTKFRFFLQTNCGHTSTAIFTTNIAAVKGDTDDPGKPTEEPPGKTGKTMIAIIITVLSCFIIVALILFLWMRLKTSRSQPDYNMAACENNTSEPSDRETM